MDSARKWSTGFGGLCTLQIGGEEFAQPRVGGALDLKSLIPRGRDDRCWQVRIRAQDLIRVAVASRGARYPTIQVPDAPMWWPRVIAPQCAFTISGSTPNSRLSATATAAEASLISVSSSASAITPECFTQTANESALKLFILDPCT